MPVAKRRDRIVIFRLTIDEYENLKSVSITRGARNLSDFARTELLNCLERDPAGNRVQLGESLSNIEIAVKRIMRLLERSRSDTPRPEETCDF
jgi:hypothetical protein